MINMANLNLRKASATDHLSNARSNRLIPVDNASAIPRPPTIGDTYGELAWDAQSVAQEHLFKSEAERISRVDSARHSALSPYANESGHLIAENRSVVSEARKRFLLTGAALSPWRRRKGSGWGYRLRACALCVGEVMGPANAAIIFGDIPALAILQAVSAGTATITAGLTGAEFKHLHLSAERKREKPEDVSGDLMPYQHLFDGSGLRARRYATIALASGLTVGLLVASAIFSLRAALDGSAVGVAFGSLALAVTVASFINSYCHADPVSDLIDEAHGQYRKELRAHRRLTARPLLLFVGRAKERSRSITAEQHHRGDAASSHLTALSYESLTGSPDVVGHGPAAPAIGRRIRKADQ
ncbi:hypothetical protein BS618_16820 [Rhodococcus erythropolis]|nr:hypothetical protein AOT96_22100 [Rhodococcus sp. 008]OKA13611.1 hypothetical protein BS618_16820 [Rhodococcus erythropolis]